MAVPPPGPPHMSSDQFRALGHKVVDWIAAYMRRVEDFPVLAQTTPGDVLAQLPAHPPQQPLNDPDWASVFSDLDRTILPNLTHWQSPNFFAFFPCNASGPAILGEFLSAGLNVNAMLWATSPAATELETRTLDWLAQMLDLPPAFHSTGPGGGVIQGTASESTLIALVAARARISSSLRLSVSSSPLTLYASTQSHSSVIKAAMIAGLAASPDDRTHLRLIDTDATHAMRPDLLTAAIREDRAAGRVPIFVCATVGTTSSTAVDPVPAIARVIAETTPPNSARPWLHIDAAHSGCACICPEHRWMLDGVEHADSLCLNPHKWLLTNFDCDCFYIRDRRALIDALSVTPEYLRNAASEAGAVIDYRDWGIPLGRRFRALKLWLVIRHYGVVGLRAYIREHLRLAALFESLVAADPRFELSAPRTVNLVCFRLRPAPGQSVAEANAANKSLLDRLNTSGRLYITHTTLRSAAGENQLILRMAIGAAATQERHIRAAWQHIQMHAGDERVRERIPGSVHP